MLVFLVYNDRQNQEGGSITFSWER